MSLQGPSFLLWEGIILFYNKGGDIMAINKGTIVYVGDYGVPEAHKTKGVFRDVTDDTALSTLATALSAYTDANISGRVFSVHTDTGLGAPGASVNMDVKAMVVLRDSDDGSIIKFLIPAPINTIWDAEGQGDRMNDATLTAIATAVSTATGHTYVGLYGKKLQKT